MADDPDIKWETIKQEAQRLCRCAHWVPEPDTPVARKSDLWRISTPNGPAYQLPKEGVPLWSFYVDQARKSIFPLLGAPKGYREPSRICDGSLSGIHSYVKEKDGEREFVRCSLCNNVTGPEVEEIVG